MSNSEQQPSAPQQQPQPQQVVTEPTNEEDIAEQQQQPSEDMSSDIAKQFKKMVNGFRDEYDKQIMTMMDENKFTIALNIPKKDANGNPMTEPDVVDPSIQVPVYDGTENQQFNAYPMSPQQFARYRKLQKEYDDAQAAKDPDATIETQIKLYRFMGSCFFKMSAEQLDRVANWIQFKKAIEACLYKVLFKPDA